jgi:fructokinase
VSSRSVLVIGEALVDIVRAPGLDDVEHVGGSPANVAMGLAHLDLDVSLATALGRDARGDRVAEHLAERGVTLLHGSRDAARTSTAIATLDAEGAATYVFDLVWDPGTIDIPDGVVHVHTGSIASVLEPGSHDVEAALEQARTTRTVSYDPNVRPTIMGDLRAGREHVERMIGLADVVKASEDDVAELYAGSSPEEVVARWTSLGPALAVVTRAAEGAVLRVGPTDEIVELPAAPTTVVDTVGAGDSFMAGLVSGLVDLGFLGGSEARARLATAGATAVRPAVERALACGARTVARAGAYAPHLDEL